MKMIYTLMDYENGKLNAEETIKLFQNLIDSGLIFGLQGHYLEVARDLVEAGLVNLTTADIEE
jgi:hypothetical protein